MSQAESHVTGTPYLVERFSYLTIDGLATLYYYVHMHNKESTHVPTP